MKIHNIDDLLGYCATEHSKYTRAAARCKHYNLSVSEGRYCDGRVDALDELLEILRPFVASLPKRTSKRGVVKTLVERGINE